MSKILNGEALVILKTLDNESIDMCMTSPPYFGLRDYGSGGQLGLEPTYQEYIDKLIAIFDEVKRVLKDTGTCFVNLGDTYSGMKTGNTEGNKNPKVVTNHFIKAKQDISSKSLIGIPERFVIAMTDSDRSDIYEINNNLTEAEQFAILKEIEIYNKDSM